MGREDNHLIGGQAGINLALWDLAGPLSINCEPKAGNVSDNDFAHLLSNGGQFLGGKVLDGATHPRNFFGATPLSQRPISRPTRITGNLCTTGSGRISGCDVLFRSPRRAV
jgi:hypothetical protein